VRRALAAALALAAAPGLAAAGTPVASTGLLPTGNGHGLAVFDADANALTTLLERPYRFVRRDPANPDGDGILRRDLAYDAYFGVRVEGETAWLGERDPDAVGYVDQSNVIRSAAQVGPLATESFFVAPFGLERNAVVMVLTVTNTSGRAVDVDAFSVQNLKLGAAPDPEHPGDADEALALDAELDQARETGPGGGTAVYVALGGLDAASCADGAWQAVKDGGALATVASCAGDDQAQVFHRALGTLAPGA
jgi:hypothetical protein